MMLIHLSGKMQIGWQPGIGDPTFMGWLTVIVYFLVALFAWFRGRTAVPHQRFWQGIAFTLLLLGINKQLNLLSLLTSLSRQLAWQQAWYGQRQAIQTIFVGLIALAIVGLFTLIMWRLNGRYRLSALLLLLLISFVLIRAASLHTIDYYLFTPFAGIRLNWIIELGLLLSLLAAISLPPAPTSLPTLPNS